MNQFLAHSGVEAPIIGGPMYPCSNPELVAAQSDAGALGVIQPLSLTYVHGYDFRDGLKYIRSLTDKPVGFNALIEKSTRKYHERMAHWVDIALEEGVRFFITSLGKPDWVVERVHAYGGVVYHDVSEKKWARIGVDCGVDGLICVNRRAGGHCGEMTAQQLYDACAEFEKPMVCAGGVSTHQDLQAMLDIGYQACQLGTRFIASQECKVSDAYKQAIVDAVEEDVTTTYKMTGIPVSIIKPDFVEMEQLKVKGIIGWMLRSNRFKRLARVLLSVKTMRRLKTAIHKTDKQSEYWMAGKSVAGVHKVLPVREIVKQLMDDTHERSS